MVKELGFDGVELPVRSGYQLSPEKVTEELRRAAKIFATMLTRGWLLQTMPF